MRQAVRAIVIHDGKLLVMHRNKFGRHYDTLPGGRVEVGETYEQALLRELSEETGVTIANQRLIFIEHAGDPYGDQYIFLCDYTAGQPRLSPGSDEEAIHKLGENLYEPGWIEISELPDKPFVSERLKAKMLDAFKTGWPIAPEEF